MLIHDTDRPLAFDQATGELGRHVPGTEPPSADNPLMVARQTDCDTPLRQLILEVTQQCNLRCTYCHHTHGGAPGVRGHREVYMASETAEAAMQLLEGRGDADAMVCFYGGEPLMNFDLIREVVERRPGRRYQIDSNGIWIGEEIAEWAAGYDISWQISLDGDARTTNRYRGVHTFGLARAGIRALRYAKPDVQVRVACTLAPPWRIDQAAACFEDDQMRGLPLSVNFADLTGCAKIAAESFPWDHYRALYRAMCLDGRRDDIPRLIRQLFEPDLIRLYHREVGRFDSWVAGGCCDPGARRLFVDSGGALYPCEKTRGAHRIGHVTTGIDWAVVDEMHRMFHVERQDRGCQDCWALRLCGGCWVAPIDCEREKARLEDTMRLYADLWEGGAGEWMKNTEVS